MIILVWPNFQEEVSFRAHNFVWCLCGKIFAHGVRPTPPPPRSFNPPDDCHTPPWRESRAGVCRPGLPGVRRGGGRGGGAPRGGTGPGPAAVPRLRDAGGEAEAGGPLRSE